MAITFKTKNGKHKLIARDETQAAAFKNQGLVPATKADSEKLEGKQESEQDSENQE